MPGHQPQEEVPLQEPAALDGQHHRGPLCQHARLSARWWQTKEAVKLHLLLDHDGYLPENAQRSVDDPFEGKKTPRGLYLFLLILVVAAVWIRVGHKKRGHYIWQKPAVEATTNAETGAPPKAAVPAVSANTPAP